MNWHRRLWSDSSIRIFILSLSLFYYASLFSQSSANGKISGIVTNTSGQPLAGVEVRAVASTGTYFHRITYSNADGRYLISDLPVGQYYLRVQNKSGYLNVFYNNVLEKSDATMIKINSGQHVEKIDFCLERGGFIRGQLYDDKGNKLSAIASIGFVDGTNFNSRGFINNNSDGSYISPALPAGPHIVKASSLPSGFMLTYYKNVSTQDSAQAVQVAIGDTIENIDIVLQRGGAISGYVRSDALDSKPIVDAWMVITNYDNGEWSSECRTDWNGHYCAAGLRPGSYRVQVYSVDPLKYHTAFYKDVSQAENATRVYVTNKDTTKNINFSLKTVTRLALSNDFIEICVSDRYPGTNFTMKISGGLPDNPNDDNKPILFGHPFPYTSFTTLWMDDKKVLFGSSEGALIDIPYITLDYKSISREWNYGKLEVKQKISLVESEWSLTRYEDTAQIQYVVTNSDDAAHQVGLRILLDTMLGNEDSAPIRTSNHPYVYREKDFYSPNIPTWWAAIEGYNYVMNFLVQGTLSDYGATPPDRFSIVNWSNIFQTRWEYTADKDLTISKDSGIALWWNPQTIKPGETKIFSTFLGLGAMPPDVEPPYTANHIPGKDSQNIERDAKIQLDILDDYMGVDSSTIEIRVNGAPVGFKLDGDQNHYKATYAPPNKFSYNDTIKIEVDATDLAFKPNKMETEKYQFYIVRDTIPPEIHNLYPAPKAHSVPRDTSLSFFLTDAQSGVDTNSIEILLNNKQIKPQLKNDPKACFVKYHFEPPFGERDSVTTIIRAKDLSKAHNPLDTSFYFIITRDSIAPWVEFYSPHDQANEVRLDTTIKIQLVDDFTGIDRKSIQLEINDSLVSPVIDGDLRRCQIRYQPENGFCYNETIKVNLSAKDLAKISNPMTPFEFSFRTESDTTPPAVIAFNPEQNDTNVVRRPIIWAEIMDEKAGVDSASIVMQINQSPVKFTREGNKHLYRISYQPDTNFDFLEWIDVTISARDESHPPNSMNPFRFQFRIKREKDEVPPFTERHQPAKWTKNVEPDCSISFHILDDLSGVDSSSIILKVNHNIVNRQISGTPYDYEIYYKPSVPFWYGENIEIEIDASDLATNPANLMATERYSFTIKQDTLPPEITWKTPGQPGSHIAREAEFTADITDDLTGVNLESINFKLQGAPKSVRITGDKYRCQLYYKPESLFKYNEQVNVVIQVCDLATPANYNQDSLFTFYTTEDHDAPYIVSLNPKQDETVADFNTDIIVTIADEIAGIDSNTIVMTVEGEVVVPEITGNSYSYTLRYHKPTGYRPGQEVNVTVSCVDFSNPPNQMTRDDYRFFILTIDPDIYIKNFSVDHPQVLVHKSVRVDATIGVKTVPVFDAIHVQIWDNNFVVVDSMLAPINKDEESHFFRSIIFDTKDKHQLKLVVDPYNTIKEENESNNLAVVSVDVDEGDVTVRSNPFTPNGDGINDIVTFNFEQLSVIDPLLKLYDVSGRMITSIKERNGYSFIWNGTDRFGNQAQPGVYLYLLQDQERIIANGYIVLAR